MSLKKTRNEISKKENNRLETFIISFPFYVSFKSTYFFSAVVSNKQYFYHLVFVARALFFSFYLLLLLLFLSLFIVHKYKNEKKKKRNIIYIFVINYFLDIYIYKCVLIIIVVGKKSLKQTYKLNQQKSTTIVK